MADPRSWFSFGGTPKSTPPPTRLVFGQSVGTPGSPGVATPTWDVEKDTDTLFRLHGIEEIKQIEKQTRLDIDSRREGLRQMVGEKYRDLIDAADSIVDMQKCSEQVKQSIMMMETLCQKLQRTHFLKGSGGMRGPMVKNEAHGVASQLKLLADCPEKVWVCLEGRCYLQAAQHYLLARHIYSQLGVGGGGGRDGTSGVVQKLWRSISCFKDIILECCHCHLQCSDLEQGPMVQSLCTMVLLEGCSPRQAFTQFLLARKTAIQSSFQSDPGQHRSVKNQISHLVRTLLHSLLHIAAIFCQRYSPAGKKEPSLLLQQLLQFAHKDKQHKTEGMSFGLIPDHVLPLLPTSVTGFSPTVRSTMLTEILAADIHSSTEDWIAVCASDVLSGVGKLLQHVTSIKAISSIKAAIHSLLAVPSDGAPDSAHWVEQWAEICHLILNRKLSIWETFFQPVLLQRVKLLLDKRFATGSSHASTQLTNLLDSMTSDPAGYHSDIHCHTHLWKENQSNKGQLDGIGDLTLKSKSCTPAIYSFCCALGEEMSQLIEDVSHYIQPVPPTPAIAAGYKSKPQLDSFPFPLYADTASLQEFLQQSAIQWITRFVQDVDVRVTMLQQSVVEDSEGVVTDHDQQTIDKLLVVGRLCQCLLDCCQSLSYLTAGARTQPLLPTTSRFQSSANVVSQLPKEANKIAHSAAEVLQRRAISIFKVWANWSALQLTQHLGGHLSSTLQLSSLASSLVWNEVTISEEAESGKKVTSVIQVPSQASTYVSSLLFALCQEIGHVGGHAMDRQILEHLSGATLVGVVKAYEALLEDLETRHMDVPQPCALQLFYNLKFVVSVLSPPKDSEGELAKQIRSVQERLQGWVDPFDLDVFMPYLLSNLESQLSRSSVMLGVLLAIKGTGHRPQLAGSTGAGHDKHMLLPLAPVMGRIPALPLSSKSSQHHVVPLQDVGLSSSLLQRISFFHHL